MTLLNTLDGLIVAYKNASGKHDQRTHAPSMGGAVMGQVNIDAGSWQILGKHHNLVGVTITESVNSNDDTQRRFTATIRGFRNWRLVAGSGDINLLLYAIEKARTIRDKIDAGDETVFSDPNSWDIIKR